MRNQEQGSGMKCDEETELKMALSEIIEKEQAADLERNEYTNTLNKKNENKKASGQESRLKALKCLGQTKKGTLIYVMKLSKQKAEEVPLKLCKFENEKQFRKEEMEFTPQKKKEFSITLGI